MNNIITLSIEDKIPIPINHDKQRLMSTILTDDEILIQLYQGIDEESGKIFSTFAVIQSKLPKTQLYEFKDEVFGIRQVDSSHISFLAYEKDYLQFLNHKTGEFSYKYNECSVQLLFSPQVNLQINEYRDLYFNQALSYSISKDKVFAIQCDFSILDKNELLVCLQKNNQVLQIYSIIQKNGRQGEILLFDVGTKFIALNSIIEKSNLIFWLFNGQQKTEHTVQLNINEDTSVVQVFELKGNLIFILNENNCGNPWIVVIDFSSLTIKYCAEIIFSMGINKFAVVLDVFLVNNCSLFFYYEMNIEGMYNEQFLQSVIISDDVTSFKVNLQDYMRFPESSISKILTSNNSFVIIPRAVEIGTIKQNYIEFDVAPISIEGGDSELQLIEKLNKESKIVLYYKMPNIICYAYHYMQHCQVFSYKTKNDLSQIGEDIIKKMLLFEENLIQME